MPATMRAVAHRENLPVDDPSCLVDVELPVPEPGSGELLVRVEAVSVNPVDTKVRRGRPVGADGLRVLGYDAAGTVEAVGPATSRFAVGDRVFYAGSIDRPGTNAELHVVEERLVGPAPASLTPVEAAALPLTTITAWESLFHHLALGPDATGSLVVVAAAGGVGSMVTQLARVRTGLRVIGSASRPESAAWAREMGAHEIVDHHGPFATSVLALEPGGVDHVFSPYTPPNLPAYAEMLRPFGHLVAIDEAPDLNVLKTKSITWHWEYMFTRPVLLPGDDRQHRLLTETAQLVDAGRVRTTLATTLSPLDAATLREAHWLVESTATIGKVVVAAA